LQAIEFVSSVKAILPHGQFYYYNIFLLQLLAHHLYNNKNKNTVPQ